MKGKLLVDIGQLLSSASLALDAVEGEVLGVAGNHSRRVAYLSVMTGKRLGLTGREQSDLASYACLHDNALTEYVTMRRNHGDTLPIDKLRDDFAYHCIAGEQSIGVFPFYEPVPNVIKYHHENIDGSGLFGVRGEDIPLMARLIRMADNIDSRFNTSGCIDMPEVQRYMAENAGVLFDREIVKVFADVLKEALSDGALKNDSILQSMDEAVPGNSMLLSYNDIIKISSFYAHIIDYKSPFTLRHSTGIADKIKALAGYYDFDDDMYNQICIAAFLHDIGKLAISDKLLEKPGKLTAEEFRTVSLHVWYTHEILMVIDSFDMIERWASSHHERLDGSGYYRGAVNSELDQCSKMLACIDVYQALVEDRPYRRGMDNDEAMSILKNQAASGKLDRQIVSDIEKIFR